MVLETVRRARKRILMNEALRHAAYASSAALASLVLLLLVGTQILNWGWLILLPALTLAAGGYLMWRSVPASYRVAQRVDRNLKLADALSTALFFSGNDRGGEMRRAQWTQAEQIAASVDVRRAIPLAMPRAVYATALLALLAGSLFALRYGLDRRLDLRAPLARMVQEKLGYSATRQASRAPQNQRPRDPRRPDEPGVSTDDSGQKTRGELDAAPDSTLDKVDVPDVDGKNPASRAANAKSLRGEQLGEEQAKGDQPEGVNTNPAQQSADGRQGPSPGTPGKSGKQGQSDDKQSSANPGENSGLLGKFRDAMSSLINKMRPQQPGQQNGGQQKGQSGNAGQKGQPGQQPADGQRADAKSDAQPGEESQDAQTAQSGTPGESGQQPATKQPGSGIGSQDGAKDVKLAEQLAAMGKISEIIGKRAANVSGELTVEVENSHQQLRTPYAQRDARHGQAGGEINRDEVPLALQPYVQQYFEQVRKQAAKAKPEASKPGL